MKAQTTPRPTRINCSMRALQARLNMLDAAAYGKAVQMYNTLGVSIYRPTIFTEASNRVRAELAKGWTNRAEIRVQLEYYQNALEHDSYIFPS